MGFLNNKRTHIPKNEKKPKINAGDFFLLKMLLLKNVLTIFFLIQTSKKVLLFFLKKMLILKNGTNFSKKIFRKLCSQSPQKIKNVEKCTESNVSKIVSCENCTDKCFLKCIVLKTVRRKKS